MGYYKKITPKADLMRAGEPCYRVEDFLHGDPVGTPYFARGFTCHGAVFVKAEGTKAWIEFHGDDANFDEAGGVEFAQPDDARMEIEPGLNFLPNDQFRRLLKTAGLSFGAVLKGALADGAHDPVTWYANRSVRMDETVVRVLVCRRVPVLRFDGEVRSVTMLPPVLGPGEPLNSWIETEGTVTFP